jgi:hypothetical protein
MTNQKRSTKNDFKKALGRQNAVKWETPVIPQLSGRFKSHEELNHAFGYGSEIDDPEL